MTKATRHTAIGLFTLITLLAIFPVANAAQTLFGTIAQPLSRTSGGDFTLALNIGGKAMNLVMQPSSVVSANTRMVEINGHPKRSSFRSFQGVIKGVKESWVRLSIHNDSLSGVVSKQGNRYKLGASATSLMTLKLLSEQSSHNLHTHATQLRQTRSLPGSQSIPEVSHVVDVAIVVDSQYNAVYNGKGLEKALSVINSVDGLYREEFGIALRVVSALNIADHSQDPFDIGTVPIESMLRNLRDYRMQTAQFNDASLVHLFTGNPNSDAPVGLAWIDTACRTDGYDVGLSTPYRYDILLTAHEIAHNLGAHHDSDTACSIENNKVMWPYISNHTSQNFSSCTLDSVRQSLQNSCHVKTLDLQVSLIADDESTVTAMVKNNDLEQSSTSSTLVINLPNNTVATALNGDCITPMNTVECSIGTLLPGAENSVRLNIENLDVHASPELIASIDSDEFPDLTRGNNTASVQQGKKTAADTALALKTDTSATTSDFYLEGGGSVDRLLILLVLIPLVARRVANSLLA